MGEMGVSAGSAEGSDPAENGIHLAQAAMTALADNVQAPDRGDQAALAVLNGCSSTGEAVWAAAYLLAGVRTEVETRVGRNPHRQARALRALIANGEDDVVETLSRIRDRDHHV
jgi:hypothetical protein